MVITSQTFTFSPPSQGVAQMTQATIVSSVPLDGSSTVSVAFPTAFAQVCQSVTVTYNPPTETDYQVVGAVIGTPTVNGFTLSATGGPVGSTGTFAYTAVGI